MVKQTSVYVCQQCGSQQARWFGKCPECGSWGSLVETVVSIQGQKSKTRDTKDAAKPVSLTSVPSKATSRISTNISELDRVLGGGLVAGQVVLIAGEPGIGKSTILLQLADKLGNFLYVSGEESVSQIKIRADRLGVKNKDVSLLEETDIDSVIDTIATFKGSSFKGSTSLSLGFRVEDLQGISLKGVVVDSIQTMATSDLSGMAGSVGQVRESAYRLVRVAKKMNIPVFIVGHVTKQGSVAGPSVLMHIVDTVLWFEGDKTLPVRLLRAVKNRFGPTDEVGIFSMEDKGLLPVDTPEKMFLTKAGKSVSGSVITSVLQGTRVVLVEVQALVVPTKMAFPKRISQGYDGRRYELMLAVLTRRCGLPLNDYDCFLNISGGISIKNDPSADLAICLATASSFFDKPFISGTIALGEIGLLGDIREVVAQEKRVKEAKRLGFKNVISSKEIKYLQEGIKRYIKHTG